MFTTHLGAALDAGNVRKMFKRVCAAAGIGDGWTPRELHTSFVSLTSHRGGVWVRVQERFAELINSIDGTNIPWNDLDQHGLTGEELRLKRRRWRERIFASGRRMNRRWVRSALGQANTILESLAAVFPVAGAIKEFKESAENLIEDAAIDAKRKRRGRLRNSRDSAP